jgi:uncharacterized protein YrrD
MLGGHTLVGRVVISRDGGERIGEVKDLIVSADGTRVLAFEVHPSGFLTGSRYFVWDSIQSVGEDAVIIDSRESLRKADDFPEVKEILDRGNMLVGRSVHTTSGRTLGRIEGFFLDPHSGNVTGYELSGGPHATDQGERSFLPATSSMETGRDVVFVPPEAESSVEDVHVVLRSEERRAA